MFERIAIKYLRQWAKKEDRKPLVLRGARQVGKTTLVKLFAKEFDTYIYMNLEEKEYAELFAADYSFEELKTYNMAFAVSRMFMKYNLLNTSLFASCMCKVERHKSIED